MTPRERLDQLHPEMTAWRRDFHAHPEIGFEEERTSALVAERLSEWGIEVHRGFGGTGVVGVIRGRHQAAGSNRGHWLACGYGRAADGGGQRFCPSLAECRPNACLRP
jgi:hypothetical protein